MSSRRFNQDTGAAKQAANAGPVIITDRGKPSHVLLSLEDYQELAGESRSLLEAVAQTAAEEFDFVPPRLDGPVHQPAF